jgi:hypothetical protein
MDEGRPYISYNVLEQGIGEENAQQINEHSFQ